jgi:hypothetical protein
MNITILFWVMFIIGLLWGTATTIMWYHGDTPISYISNVQEKIHPDMERYPFDPNFIDVNTSDCNDPVIIMSGYLYSIKEGMIINWMECSNAEFDYAMVVHSNGTKWEKQNKSKQFETVQIEYVVAGGIGPGTGHGTGGTGRITQWTGGGKP